MSVLVLAVALLSISDSNRLEQLHELFQGSVTNLELSWVVALGEPAIPTLVKLASDHKLPDQSRNLALVVLGNTMNKIKLRDHPDARNDAIVPVLFEAMADRDQNLRGAGAYAARFISDSRLLPGLEPLLKEKPAIQEQAVLALGVNGNAAHVKPILDLFFQADNGVFRYSCLTALGTMAVYRGVDIAAYARSNTNSFGEAHVQHMENLANRFQEFEQLKQLVNSLSSEDETVRQKACAELKQMTRAKISCRPPNIDAWRNYLLHSFWRQPAPTTPVPSVP